MLSVRMWRYGGGLLCVFNSLFPPTRTTTVCIYFHHVQTTTVLYTSCGWWWTVSISPQNISQVKHVSKHSLFQNDCILTFVVSGLQTIIFPTSFWEPFSNWNVQVLTDGLRKRAVLHFRVNSIYSESWSWSVELSDVSSVFSSSIR